MLLRRLFTTLIPTAGLMLAATAHADLSEVAHQARTPMAPIAIEQQRAPGVLSEVAHQPRQEMEAAATATLEVTSFAVSEVTTQPPQKAAEAAERTPLMVASSGSARASK
jgi:hypothetical protein